MDQLLPFTAARERSAEMLRHVGLITVPVPVPRMLGAPRSGTSPAANGMAEAAMPYTATFIAAGLPADFVPQLKSVVVQMVQSLSDRSLTHGKRKGATSSLKDGLTRGRKVVRVLDALVRKDLHLRLRLEVQVPRSARDDSSSRSRSRADEERPENAPKERVQRCVAKRPGHDLLKRYGLMTYG